MTSVPKTIRKIIKKADNFIDHKKGINVSNRQGLDLTEQGKEYSDKGGKGRGDPGLVQGGHIQYTTKQDGGGIYDSTNKTPSTKNGFYHCGKTDHILHFPPDLTKNHREDLYLHVKKQTEDKKNAK